MDAGDATELVPAAAMDGAGPAWTRAMHEDRWDGLEWARNRSVLLVGSSRASLMCPAPIALALTRTCPRRSQQRPGLLRGDGRRLQLVGLSRRRRVPTAKAQPHHRPLVHVRSPPLELALSARAYRSLTRSDLRSFGMIDNDEHLAKWEPDDSNLATLEHRIEGIFLAHMAKEGLASFQPDLLIMASLFWDAKFLRWVRDLLAILSLRGPD